MAKFTPIILGLAATITGVQAGFKKPCYAPYDTCGWSLVNAEFGRFPRGSDALLHGLKRKEASTNPQIPT